MRLLLGSGGFRTPERLELLTGQMQSFFGEIGRLLFVPYALQDLDGYLEKMQARGLDAGLRLEAIHRCPDPVKAVEEAEGIYVGGGNTFRLLNALYELDLLKAIRQRVREGLPYMGVSAGTNVACPTIMTTNDMPIVRPPSFRALGLIPFQINAHYFSGATYVPDGDGFQEHFGETRDDRIREFHEMNPAPVLGLREGGILRVQEGRYRLIGASARLFQQDAAAADIQPGDLSWPPEQAHPLDL
ncbi:MAG TPA: dipeptidase PepE [Actinomycetota bacterium]|nr:dipeptidase PepE [Actinomycetota bacterium]